MRPIVLLFAISPFTVSAQTIDKVPAAREEVLKTLATIVQQKAFVPGIDFKKWESFLASERAKIDEAKNDEEFKGAINQALKKFGFSHILLATPKDMNTRTSGKAVGLGITSQSGPDGRQITRVFEGSAANNAGLEPGDIITHVDGQKVDDKTVFSGDEGSIVKVRVKKLDGKVFDYSLTRRPFSTLRKDEIKWIKGDTALVKVNTFDRGYNADLIEAIMSDAIKAPNLIVDLRYNGGGAVNNLLDLSGYFIDPKLSLGSMLNRTSLDRFKKKYEKEPAELKELAPYAFLPLRPFEQTQKFKGNIVVLINAGTGSASEIFTAALKEQYKKTVSKDGTITFDKDKGDITVIGSKSAGAVLFSTYYETAHGFFLQTPIADYLTPSGVRLEGNPIAPDANAEEPRSLLPGAEDKQIDAALAIFERIKLRGDRTKPGY